MSLKMLSSAPWTVSELVDTVLTRLRSRRSYLFDTALACTAIWALLRWGRIFRRVRTTQLRGPPSSSFLYGVGMHVLCSDDPGAVYEEWAQEYGSVYTVPWTLGRQRVVLCDPKAIAHYYAKDTWSYAQLPVEKISFVKFLGKGLFWADGESHGRQRKALMPGFSVPATRQLTPAFYDSAYKVKTAWDALIQSSNGESALIEIQDWANHWSLENIGHTGFSHSFGALEGKHAPVTEAFDAFSSSHRSPGDLNLFLLGQAFSFFVLIPTSRERLDQKLSVVTEAFSNTLLARIQKEREMGAIGGKEERSLIGLLAKGMNSDSEFHLTKKEVIAQIKALLIAGYETVSISLSWTLIELSRNPDVQTKLRNELLEHGADPSYDQLMNGFPYLDAVVHEILRFHPAVPDNDRVAIEDDVIPLSRPVRTTSGELVDSVTIAKGTLVSLSIETMNRSVVLWGEDAGVFRPSRWLEDGHGIPARAKEIQGHRHLLTFVDGPRTCPGKHFAIAELKVVLAVLVKNFVFALRDGVHSKIEIGAGILPRPAMAGEMGCKTFLHVRPCVA